MITILTFQSFDESSDTYRNYHVSGSLIFDGTFILMTFVLLVTVKLFISTNAHYKIGTLCYFFGVFNFFAMFTVENYLPGMELTGLMNNLFNFRPMYTLLFFFVSGFVLVDYGMQFIDI